MTGIAVTGIAVTGSAVTSLAGGHPAASAQHRLSAEDGVVLWIWTSQRDLCWTLCRWHSRAPDGWLVMADPLGTGRENCPGVVGGQPAASTQVVKTKVATDPVSCRL